MILLFRRSVSIPKPLWREPSTRRTLDPLDLASLVKDALAGALPDPTEPAIAEYDLDPAGTGILHLRSRPVKPNDTAGVFGLTLSGDKLKLRLISEACRREVYVPRRASRHLTTVRPGEPLRVLLNGKADWPTGRTYYLLDYYLLLASHADPFHLLPLQTYNLQADLRRG